MVGPNQCPDSRLPQTPLQAQVQHMEFLKSRVRDNPKKARLIQEEASRNSGVKTRHSWAPSQEFS